MKTVEDYREAAIECARRRDNAETLEDREYWASMMDSAVQDLIAVENILAR